MLVTVLVSVWLLCCNQLFAKDTYTPAELESAAPPVHPVTTASGGHVLMSVEVGTHGEIGQVRPLEGQPPLLNRAMEAISRWTFKAARRSGPIESRVGVLFIFRPAQIYEFRPPKLRYQKSKARSATEPPLPIKIAALTYPVNSVAEGAVVVALTIDENGEQEALEVVRDVPSLTESVKQAVRSWRFSPAQRNGKPERGTLVVVVSFVRPVVTQPKPN